MKEKWTTVSGAARMLGLAPMTIYRYVDQGLIDVQSTRKGVMLVNPNQVEEAMHNKQVGRPRQTTH